MLSSVSFVGTHGDSMPALRRDKNRTGPSRLPPLACEAVWISASQVRRLLTVAACSAPPESGGKGPGLRSRSQSSGRGGGAWRSVHCFSLPGVRQSRLPAFAATLVRARIGAAANGSMPPMSKTLSAARGEFRLKVSRIQSALSESEELAQSSPVSRSIPDAILLLPKALLEGGTCRFASLKWAFVPGFCSA